MCQAFTPQQADPVTIDPIRLPQSDDKGWTRFTLTLEPIATFADNGQRPMVAELISEVCVKPGKLITVAYFTKEGTVETLYSTIYNSKYFIELNFDKSTQYVAL